MWRRVIRPYSLWLLGVGAMLRYFTLDGLMCSLGQSVLKVERGEGGGPTRAGTCQRWLKWLGVCGRSPASGRAVNPHAWW
jgi:hypothetical protein